MGTITTRTENENAKSSIKRRYHNSVLHNHHTQCSNANAVDCSLTEEHPQAVHLSCSPKRGASTPLSASTFIYERMLMYVACTHASLVRSPHPPLKTTNYASCRIPEWSLKQQIVCRTLRVLGEIDALVSTTLMLTIWSIISKM